jgi:hypothetical protein
MPLPTTITRRFPHGKLPGAALLSCSLIAMALLVPGCGQTTGTASGGGAASSGSGDDVIAVVNKDPITKSDVYDQLQRYIPARLQGYPNNPALNEPAGRYVLQALITNKLILQTASDQKVPVTPEEIDARYNDQKMVREAQGTQSFEQFLADQGYTADAYKQSVVVPEIAQYNLLTHGVTSTPQELQAYYNSHLTQFSSRRNPRRSKPTRLLRKRKAWMRSSRRALRLRTAR